MMKNSIKIHPSGKLQGILNIPGDKSITHRALIISAVCDREVTICNWLSSLDCLSTLAILHELGVETLCAENSLVIRGVGLHGLREPSKMLDAGNSGTTLRLFSGILAAQKFSSQITGDCSLRERPMRRVIEPLQRMGAQIKARDDNFAPLDICGGKKLNSIKYALPVASAQVKSAILLANLYTQGRTQVIEKTATRNHTEIMLQHLFNNGCDTIDVPSDISSAAFFIVAATITPNSDLFFKNIGINPTRAGVLQILRCMGANIELHKVIELNGELRADLRVRSANLFATPIAFDIIPNIIDEIPILAIAAACADGYTVIRGAQELRFKESDRIKSLVQGLNTLGVAVQEFPDGLGITGGKIGGGIIDANGDHRIAMAFAIAGLVAESSVIVQNSENIATSFPTFLQLASQAGMHISEGDF